jgi:hypothetical protein
MGSESWQVRDHATRKADNFLFAYLAPLEHPDPEVQMRLDAIRQRHVYSYDQLEAWMHETNIRQYWRTYAIPRYNRVYKDDFLLREIKCVITIGPQPITFLYWEFKDEFKLSDNWQDHPFVSGLDHDTDLADFRNFLTSRDPQQRKLTAGLAGASTLGEWR